MGGYYASAMGENDEVAHAIRDHYRPRFAGDELPEGTAGCIVACADKLDTIAGIFAIGEPPTGSSDPYALRRAAIGIINILRDRLPIDPTSLIDFALELYSEQGIEFDAAEVAQLVRDFFHGRLVSMARDEKIPADTVAAVSAVHIIAPSVFFARCAALDEARKNDAETFDNLATAYARAAHISKPELGAEYDRALMGEVELALADASEPLRPPSMPLSPLRIILPRLPPSPPCARPSTVSSTRLWSWTRTSSSAIIALSCLTASRPFSPASPTSVSLPAKSKLACA